MVVDARSQSLNGGVTGVSSIDPRNKVIAPSDTTNKQRTVFLMTVDVEIRRMRALKKMGGATRSFKYPRRSSFTLIPMRQSCKRRS